MLTPPAPNRTRPPFAALLVLAAVLPLASYTAFKTRAGDWTTLWRDQPIANVAHEGGAAYSAITGRPDLGPTDRLSPAQVTEDGVVLGPPNQPRESIVEPGGGRFLFQADRVYFSASDNSDPRTNGRDYRVFYPTVGRALARSIYGATFAVWILAALWSGGFVRRGGAAAWLGASGARAVAAWYPALLERTRPAFGAPARRRPLLVLLGSCWVVALLLVVAAEGTFLTRTGQWTFLWSTAEVTDIRADTGAAYFGATGHPEQSAVQAPSPAALLEDGVQVGMRNARPNDVRREGAGQYIFLRDQVYFSTADGSDPRTNGRRYTIAFPTVSRTAARTLYAVAGAWLLVTALLTLLAFAHGVGEAIPPPVRARAQRHAVSALGIAGACSLVLIAWLRTSPLASPLATDLWTPVLLLNVGAALALRARFGRSVPAAATTAYVVALAAAFWVLTAWAPHRPQGCHATAPAPAWDLICTSGDSGSYYFGYQPGSTRQPLYPWFIGVFAGEGFVPSEYAKTAPPGTPKTSSADALMPVVRAQILLLLVSALAACVALMRWLQTPLPAAVFVWMYDQLFFTAVELNVVLTEDLVQACVFLALAAFAWFWHRGRPVALVLAGLFCGLAYLTRQAAAYAALMVFVAALWALWHDRRRYWFGSLAAVLVLAALVALPDVYARTVAGGAQQDSLQYQYRIAHAMQYAEEADLELMPDAETRAWLADAIPRRDLEHQKVDEQMADRYSRMVYYINMNLYGVATPAGSSPQTPQFFMAVATPILQRHFLEYLAYGFEFWRFGMSMPGLARLGFFGLSPWLTYLALLAAIVWIRDTRAIASATLVVCHAGAVALACLFAAPLPRMVWASECLVLVALLIMACAVTERLAGTPAGAAFWRRLDTAVGRGPTAPDPQPIRS